MTYKNRSVPKDVKEFCPTEVKPLRGFPNYFISEEGRIISTYGSKPSEMATEETKSGGNVYVTVHLTKNGKKHHRSVDALVQDHFGGNVYGQSAYEIYDYLNFCYDDPEALAWAENVVKEKISHHGPDAGTRKKKKK